MRVYKVEHARKDYPNAGIKKGDTYYWWKFRHQNRRMSKTYPNRSQLTQSDFLQTLYGIEDTLASSYADSSDDLEGIVSDIVSQIEELRDTCQGSLDNMPEALQDTSESGQLLQERIDSLEAWIDELQGVDLDVDDGLSEDEELERVEEIINELQGCSSGL